MLRTSGVHKGDRVALITPNCPQHVVALYGALRIGAIVAEHNPLAPAEEIRSQLDAHGARVVIVWEKGIDLITDPVTGPRAGSDPLRGRTVFSVDLSAAMPVRLRAALRLPVERARQQRAAFRAEGLPRRCALVGQGGGRCSSDPLALPLPAGSDVAVLLHTGGTTGTPKAAMLTHANLRANANQAIAWVPMLHEGGRTSCACCPSSMPSG